MRANRTDVAFRIAPFLLVASFAISPSAEALAFQRPRFQELSKNSEILEIPRQYNSLLEDAESAIKRKQWGEATLALGTVLGLEQSKKEQAENGPPRNNSRIPNTNNPSSRPVGQRTLGGSDQGQDYFLEVDSEGSFKRSMRSKARQMLGGIPEEGAKFVELRYGVTAKSDLDKA